MIKRDKHIVYHLLTLRDGPDVGERHQPPDADEVYRLRAGAAQNCGGAGTDTARQQGSCSELEPLRGELPGRASM